MTLRCEPSTSSSSGKVRHAAKSSKRKRSTVDEQKKAMIQEAHRLDKLRLNIKKRESSFVYVGNVRVFISRARQSRLTPPPQIPPTTTEASLRHQFKSCGPIDNIIIRCSAGAALAGQAHAFRTSHDRQYATVLFSRARSVAKALQLNNSDMQGYIIKVSWPCFSSFINRLKSVYPGVS